MANPNPSPETRFVAGESGNPGGKTSAQRKAEIRNAEKATLLRERLLDAVALATEAGATLEHIEANILRLIKDSEDRGFGATKDESGDKPEDLAEAINNLADKLPG